jgi:hypothetical protein
VRFIVLMSGVLTCLWLAAGMLAGSALDYPHALYEFAAKAAYRAASGIADPAVDLHTVDTRFSSAEAGVVVYEPAHAYFGLNVEVSATQPVARLLDMHGRELHRWSADADALGRAWAANGKPQHDVAGVHWRRVRAGRDGSLLVVVENRGATPDGFGLMKLDWNSNIEWLRPGRFHRDVDVGPDGRIYALYQDPEFGTEGVAIFSADGVEIDRIAIVDAFADTPFSDMQSGDAQMSSIAYVTEEMARAMPFARAGQVLVTMRAIDAAALFDLRSRKVAWAISNYRIALNVPRLTSRGTLLVVVRGSVIEWDLAKRETIWEWPGSSGLASTGRDAATVSLLPNGNRLITESTGDRAVEVTSAGRVVWEWRSEHRYGPHGDRVARLTEFIRVPHDYFTTIPETVMLRGSIEDAT